MLKNGIRSTLKKQFKSILRPIVYSLKLIFCAKIKKISGKVVILRSQKKFLVAEGEPDLLLREQPILVFKDMDQNFGKLPINNKENYEAIRSINVKGQDMILCFKSHFLFGDWPTKLMIKSSHSDKYIEFIF